VTPKILGIVNITEDSFSDGGRFLAPESALAHAAKLAADGAEILDLGAASSNPEAKPVPPDVEIARLGPVVAALRKEGHAISIDSFASEVQRWALGASADYLNDIHGFADTALYPVLAASPTRLIVMHAVQEHGRATRIDVSPVQIMDRVRWFFDQRFAALERAGVARARLILDPGMGFFLGSDPKASFAVLTGLGELKSRFGLPVLVSVSRKSFLRVLTGRKASTSGAATLAAELFAVLQGVDYVRTHDPGALRDALAVWEACKTG
jgi:dihydropteroate synthase type 2